MELILIVLFWLAVCAIPLLVGYKMAYYNAHRRLGIVIDNTGGRHVEVRRVHLGYRIAGWAVLILMIFGLFLMSPLFGMLAIFWVGLYSIGNALAGKRALQKALAATGVSLDDAHKRATRIFVDPELFFILTFSCIAVSTGIAWLSAISFNAFPEARLNLYLFSLCLQICVFISWLILLYHRIKDMRADMGLMFLANLTITAFLLAAVGFNVESVGSYILMASYCIVFLFLPSKPPASGPLLHLLPQNVLAGQSEAISLIKLLKRETLELATDRIRELKGNR